MEFIDKLFLLKQESRYKGIEGLRGISVLLVFNVHFFAQYASRNYLSDNSTFRSIAGFLNSGMLGVDIFFVISGYLIWKILYVQYRSRKQYLKSRVSRLLPVYFVTVFILYSSSFSLKEFIEEFLFIPSFISGHSYRNYVSWSLGWEWLFYFQILLIGFVPKTLRKCYPIIAFVLLVVLILVPKTKYIAWPDIRFLNFLWGCIVAEYSDHMKGLVYKILDSISLPYIIFSGFVWSKYCNTIQSSQLLNYSFFLSNGLMAAFLINGIVNSFSIYDKALSIKPLRIIGQISYTFYLMHSKICIPIATSIYGARGEKTLIVSYIISIIFTFIVSTIFYALVERNYFLHKVNKNA